MRLLLSMLLLVSIALFAQEKEGKKKGPPQPPKNLKVLTGIAPAEIRPMMQGFEKALGVTACTYCHVQGDFASDDNPKKETARMMITMVKEINAKFPDGKQHVACFTCHHGMEMPQMEPAAQ